jgi:hypothetical protein
VLLRIVAVALALAGVVAALALLLGPVTQWAGGSTVRGLTGKEKADAINGVRQTLLQAAAGTAALSVLLFTGLTFLLNRRGQVTDRYAKAIGLLASEKIDERVGGVYSLEHVMLESERDHDTVVQVLAAFVREHAPIKAKARDTVASESGRWMHPPTGTPHGRKPGLIEPSADVQAALTVLGRRPRRDETPRLDLRRTDLRGADLFNARLEGADLTGAHLGRARLARAHLEAAYLTSARLERADLSIAHLRHAYLGGAHLDGAYLGGAHLQGADLSDAYLRRTFLGGAHLEGARLDRAHLEGAHLDRAHLKGAHLLEVEGLTRAQISDALTDAQTRLPHYLTMEGNSSA